MDLFRRLDHAEHRIRIADSQSVPLPPGFPRLVDHPDVQRLRRVRQLGPIHLIYPGAVHTRFEHSLGVYAAAAEYLRALTGVERFRDQVAETDLLAVLLAALLHDIGHYPFAHSLEALHSQAFHAPRHEDLAARLITGELSTQAGPTLAELIADLGVDPARVIRMVQLGSRHAPDAHERLLASVINSAIDADKLDYLARDSVHMGVPYGHMPDRGRLVSGLTVNPAGDRIALTEKGRSSGEIFVFARYLMFSEAYWHHAVRAGSGMVEVALGDYIRRTRPSADALTATLLRSSDDELLALLAASGDGTAAAQVCERLVRSRGLYKRVLTLSRQHPERPEARAYERVFALDALGLDALAESLRACLAGFVGRALAPWELFVDTPPRDKDGVDPIEVVLDGRGAPEAVPLDHLSRVVAAIGADFNKVVKRIRIFVAPEVRAALDGAAPGAQAARLEAALLDVILDAAP
jgi:HD superfamily phosphohydrolase